MLPRFAFSLIAGLVLAGCTTYDYEQEFWLHLNGSGTSRVTARPVYWELFKGIGQAQDGEAEATKEAVRRAFETSGLRVRRVALTHRRGHPYVSIDAEFADVNRLTGSAAFPDLEIEMRRRADRYYLTGRWRPRRVGQGSQAGLMAVRFHLPAKVYQHDNAWAGVERGNILVWRQDIARAVAGDELRFGAVMDYRSVFGATVRLFAASIGGAALLIAATLWWVLRKGRRAAVDMREVQP